MNKGTREEKWSENFGFLGRLRMNTTYKALLGHAVSANDLERLHGLLPAHCRLNQATLIELKQFWQDWISPYRNGQGSRLADEAALWTLPECPPEGLTEWYHYLLLCPRMKMDWDRYLLDPKWQIQMGLSARYYGQSIRSGKIRKDYITIFRGLLSGTNVPFTVEFRLLEPGRLGVSFDLRRRALTEAMVHALGPLPLAAPKSDKYFQDWSRDDHMVHLCTEIELSVEEASMCLADSTTSSDNQRVTLSVEGERNLLSFASKKLGGVLAGEIQPVEIYYPTF